VDASGNEVELIRLGAVIVSTPQDVALVDARKGVAMFNKVSIPVRPLSCRPTSQAKKQIIGLLLNMSHYKCTSCSTPHELFGSSASFEKAAKIVADENR
jgi:ATP-binding protein involved in chromosome partitioning